MVAITNGDKPLMRFTSRRRQILSAPSIRRWLAVAVAIIISGNPAARAIDDVFVYPIALILILALVGAPLLRLDKIHWMVFSAFAFLISWHYFEFGPETIFASIGFFVKLSIAYLIATKIRQFPQIYVKILVYLSLLSLGIFVPFAMGLPLYDLLSGLTVDAGGASRHVIIHNFGREGLNRNSGMFWEPGAFGSYICFALILVRIYRLKLPTWQSASLWVALASTFSTAAYLAAFVILAWAVYSKMRIKRSASIVLLAPIMVGAFVILAYVLYVELPFLGEKIGLQYDRAINRGYLYQINRIGNLLYDLELIMQRPLFGWSAYLDTRLSFDRYATQFFSGQGNGLSGFATSFGLIGLSIFFIATGIRTFRLNGRFFDASFVLLVAAILLSAQKLLNYPVFLTLPFLLGRACGANLHPALTREARYGR